MYKDWIWLSILFVRESLYRSLLVRRGGFRRFLGKLLFPSINDTALTYNIKWFLTGLVGGLLMGFWLPLIAWSLEYLGSGGQAIVSLVHSYLILMFLVSIVLIMDFMHQVLSTVRELSIVEPLRHLPIDIESLRKALAYSIVFGGALSFLIGVSFASSIIVYIIMGIPYPLVFVPIGMISVFLIVYPLVFYMYYRAYGKVHGIIGVLSYVLVIAGLMTIYISAINITDNNNFIYCLTNLAPIIPINYVLLSMGYMGLDAILPMVIYIFLGITMILVIPARIGVEAIISETSGEKPVLRVSLNRAKYISLGLKDLVLLVRDSFRLKQFYGQSVTIIIPTILLLLTSDTIEFMERIDIVTQLFLLSLYGLIAYVMASIVSVIILFVEGEHSIVNYILPLSKNDIVLGKVIGGYLAIQPLFIIVFLIALARFSLIHGLMVLYVFNTYWLLSSYINVSLAIDYLYSEPRAWTEFSIGALRRLFITLISILPLTGIITLIIPVYLINSLYALLLMILIPVPVTAYMLYKCIRGHRHA